MSHCQPILLLVMAQKTILLPHEPGVRGDELAQASPE